MLKKVSALVLSFLMGAICFSWQASAAPYLDAYDQVLAEANARSGLEFVRPDNVKKWSIEEFRTVLNDIILEQKAMEQRYEKRMLELNSEMLPPLTREALSTKTVTKDVWNSIPYHVKGTFDYTKNPPHIQNLRNLKLTQTLGDIILDGGNFAAKNEKFSVSYIDSSRTAAVRITCTMTIYRNGQYITSNNYKMYTEFHFDS